MNYKETIEKLFNNNGSNILNEYFRANSLLLDYVGSSIYDKRLVEVILMVYKIVDVYLLFKVKGLDDARNTLQEMYKYNYFNCTKQELVDAINPISDLLYPNSHSSNKNNKSNAAIIKTNNTVVTSNKVSLNDIDTLDIKFISGSLNIKLGDDKKSYIQIDKRKVRKIEKYYQNNRFIFDVKDRIVTININSKKLKNINIIGNVKYIDISTPIYSKCKINSINIDTVNTSNLCSTVDTKTIDVKVDGSAYVSGKIKDASIETSYGDLSFYLITSHTSTMNLNLYSKYGNINGRFSDKLMPRVTSIFKKTNKVDKFSYSGKCLINLLAKSDNGRIKIR